MRLGVPYISKKFTCTLETVGEKIAKNISLENNRLNGFFKIEFERDRITNESLTTRDS